MARHWWRKAVLQSYSAEARQSSSAKGDKGKAKGKGKKGKGGKTAMVGAESKTFEELLEDPPQDSDPYDLMSVWLTTAAAPAEQAERVYTIHTGWDRFGELVWCHAGDGCSRQRCVYWHTWG